MKELVYEIMSFEPSYDLISKSLLLNKFGELPALNHSWNWYTKEDKNLPEKLHPIRKFLEDATEQELSYLLYLLKIDNHDTTTTGTQNY